MTAIERWARRKALKIDLIHNLPKAVQREIMDALLDAYARGYEAAVCEMGMMPTPLDGGSDGQRKS